jgi:hypothetical protein
MRFLMFVKANKESEAGVLPDEKILSEMSRYNEQLAKTGALLAADGLKASSKGARVRYAGGKVTVTDGPFTEAKELVAGYWLIQAKSLEEAVDWAKRVPFEEGEVEIRPLFEVTDSRSIPRRSPAAGVRRRRSSAPVPRPRASPERSASWGCSRPIRTRRPAKCRTRSSWPPWAPSSRRA